MPVLGCAHLPSVAERAASSSQAASGPELRVYRRVGDRETRRFLGRFVFSTNRELSGLVRWGELREDLYTRVNVLRVVMPPLRRILREAPDERRHYVHGFTAETLAQSLETWDGWAYRIEADIARRKGGDAWRGNLRELRNYVRNCILSSRLVTEETGQNQSETARRLEISWRRARQWIDPILLARWAALPAP